MDCSKMRKSQGRISSNVEVSEKLQALFSQQSDTSLVSSVAECSADEKGEVKADHSTSTSTAVRNFINTCVEVNSLPKIVITPPPPANGNGAEKEGNVNSDDNKHSIKLPLLLRPAERIPSASSRSTRGIVKKTPPRQPPLKLPLLKPDRICSASLRRKQPLITSRPSPIEEEKPANRTTGDRSAPAINNDKEGSDRELKSTVEQPSPSSNNTEQNQSGSQAAGEEVKGEPEVQCPTPSTTYDDLYSDDFEEDDDDDEDDDCDDNNDGGDTDSGRHANQHINKRSISGTNRRLDHETLHEKAFTPCVFPQYQRSRIFDAAAISPLVKTKSVPSLSETSKLPTTVSVGLQPKVLLLRRRKDHVQVPMQKAANVLNTLHCPTKISPVINRSPLFTDAKDKDDGLISFEFSPKLNSPHRHYFGRKIRQQHPAQYSNEITDGHLAKFVKMQAPSSSSSSSSSSWSCCPDYHDEHDFDDNNDEPPEKLVAIMKKASEPNIALQVKEDATIARQENSMNKPFCKRNSYLKMVAIKCKPVQKLQLFNKPSIYMKNHIEAKRQQVLPPITSKLTEDKQPTLVLKPTPPQSQPASGRAASLRLMRRACVESKQKNKTSLIGKKQ